jgi:ACDE family multidrug resistance protein
MGARSLLAMDGAESALGWKTKVPWRLHGSVPPDSLPAPSVPYPPSLVSHAPASEPSSPQWPALALILGVTAVGQLTFAAVPPVLPELADALGVSGGSIGLVHGIVAVAGIFLSGYLGYLADRFGRRRVVRLSLLVHGAFGSACFFAGNYWVLLALRLLQGVGATVLMSIGIVLIGDYFTGYRRRWAMGLNVGAITVTGTLGPIAAGLLGSGGAFRPFLLYLLAFPAWVAARRLPGPAAGAPARPGAHLRDALADLRRRRRLSDYLGILPLTMVNLAVFMGLTQAVAPLFLQKEFALNTTQRGLVLAIGAGVSSLASLLSGRLGRRVRPAPVIATALGLMVAGYVAVGLAPNLWAVGLGLALVGSGYGSMTPLFQAFATSAGAPRYRGLLVGTWVTGNRVGMVAGPATATAVAASLGERDSYLLGALVVGAVAVVWVPLRRLAAARMR